jgi:hypothetical protein
MTLNVPIFGFEIYLAAPVPSAFNNARLDRTSGVV